MKPFATIREMSLSARIAAVILGVGLIALLIGALLDHYFLMGLATGLVIASVGEPGKGLISGPSTGVEVKVPEASLAEVLSAVGQEGSLVLVPTGQEAPAEKAS